MIQYQKPLKNYLQFSEHYILFALSSQISEAVLIRKILFLKLKKIEFYEME
jgi:hypothetical protein